MAELAKLFEGAFTDMNPKLTIREMVIDGDQLAQERFTVLLLEGEAGIGKTTLWREVVRRAEERQFVVTQGVAPPETAAAASPRHPPLFRPLAMALLGGIAVGSS